MRIPGDIVSALLQGHRTWQARLGVAVSGGRGGCPAPDGAAGLARQESHPRAAAQRRTHGPCADLPRGETKVRGAARPAGPTRVEGHRVSARDASAGFKPGRPSCSD
uniref:Uncharacterized protein n=1 Tax=Sus scrofa TaxID=9823 RepID=A0A4X1U542_PIG